MIFILGLHFLYSQSSRHHLLRRTSLLRPLCALLCHPQKASREHPFAHSPRARRQPHPSAASTRRRPRSSPGATAAPRRRSLNVWCLDI